MNLDWLSMTRMAATAVLLLSVNPCSAQVYRCSGSSGTYLSDRPCSGSGPAPVSIRSLPAPAAPAPRFSTVPSIGTAPDHLQYLGSECAQMNDALRTAPARGVGGLTLSQLRTNYSKRCGDEEQQARNRLSQDEARARNDRKAQQVAQQTEQQNVVRTREQCSEMLRILHGKRQRLATMSPGEASDHERFESNYKSRCTGI